MYPQTQRLLGWILAAVGLLGLLIGLILGGLAILLQLMDSAGPTNNLEGFAVVFGLCPLPLIIIGGTILAIGLVVVFFARGE